MYVCMYSTMSMFTHRIVGNFWWSTFCEILDKVVRVNLVVVIFVMPCHDDMQLHRRLIVDVVRLLRPKM